MIQSSRGAGDTKFSLANYVAELLARRPPHHQTAGLPASTARPLPEIVFSNIIKPMEVRFTPEHEAQFTQLASNAGTDAQGLGKNAALSLLDHDAHIPHAFPDSAGELPAWHLGAIGPLLRRHMYNRP